MAVIYYTVRLLPPGHPYVNPANVGRFGIRNVVSEAYRHISFKKENIDQVIIFFALIAGFIILVFQFITIFLFFLIRPAAAAAFAGLFTTTAPDNDIAFMMLDSVFGIPGFFGSCVDITAPSGPCSNAFPTITAFPSPVQQGLHTLFEFYNLAILLVGVLIFLYYVIIMVGETAHTGTPFGRRFNHIWAPIRLVVALGLLVPLNYGFNSAQYITLYAAKIGSSFATYGWNTFNAAITASGGTNPIGWNTMAATFPASNTWYGDGGGAGPAQKHYLVARPTAPLVQHIVQFMMLVSACRVAYEAQFYDTAGTNLGLNGSISTTKPIAPYIVTGPNTSTRVDNVGTPPYDAALLTSVNNQDIRIVFGHFDPARYPEDYGGVKPYCGEIIIPTKAVEYNGALMPGVFEAQAGFFYWIIYTFYDDYYLSAGARVRCMFDGLVPADRPPPPAGITQCGDPLPGGPPAWDDPRIFPPSEWVQENAYDFEQAYVENDVLRPAYDAFVAAMPGTFEPQGWADVADRGWAGAGMWYNSLAEWNGGFISAVRSLPSPSRMPLIMEKIKEFRNAQNENMNALEMYHPFLSSGQEYKYEVKEEATIAKGLDGYYQNLRINVVNRAEGRSSGNMFLDVINNIFGIEGLFAMRQNDHVHPMVQLISLGRSIVDSALDNLLKALAFALAGGAFEAAQHHPGTTMATVAQSWYTAFTTMGLTIGFILYYVLPFLPFIYFFFAVSSWVKAIFEAMVGVPLWALAHLRVDGNGLPGETAMNGYFLILDIFLRPILTVFGLLASFIIFSAMARTLNGLFTVVVQNLTGFDGENMDSATNGATIFFKRAAIDQFFFTIVYTILVYMIATSSFKLIDQIPDGILRWMGTGAKTFGDQEGDQVGNFTQYAAFGGANITRQAIDAGTQGARALGGATGTLADAVGKAIPPLNTIPKVR